jgi:hypothetical protein
VTTQPPECQSSTSTFFLDNLHIHPSHIAISDPLDPHSVRSGDTTSYTAHCTNTPINALHPLDQVTRHHSIRHSSHVLPVIYPSFLDTCPSAGRALPPPPIHRNRSFARIARLFGIGSSTPQEDDEDVTPPRRGSGSGNGSDKEQADDDDEGDSDEADAEGLKDEMTLLLDAQVSRSPWRDRPLSISDLARPRYPLAILGSLAACLALATIIASCSSTFQHILPEMLRYRRPRRRRC